MQCTIDDCGKKLLSSVACTDHVRLGFRACKICRSIFQARAKPRPLTCSAPCDDEHKKQRQCIISGCATKRSRRGLCQMHAIRDEKWGDPLRFGPIVECNKCGIEFEAATPWQKSCGELCRYQFKAQYREENRERRAQYTSEWGKRNRVRRRLASQSRRAKVRSTVFAVTDRDIRRLLARYRYECAYCEADLLEGYHLDHVMPINRGGTHSIGNLVPACARCNESKSDWLLYEWLLKQRIGRPLRKRRAL